ncbi:MAG TPA: hypothetical protein P5081_24850 [Phycisphaerae bacterium]|nr:hypothetical protein [Phycisphaerae bacterium]HRW56115.1 hypothetical protein [Phycisphaerae bacterium]
MDDRAVDRDGYYFNLLAGVGLALNVIASMYVGFLAFHRIPSHKVVFDDFDSTLPAITSIVVLMRAPLFGIPVLGVLLAIAALAVRRRGVLTASWVAFVLSFGAMMLMHYAIDLPMCELYDRIGGQ